jgi:putative heme-binding domain-containing protein
MVFDGLHADQIERLSEDPSVFVRFQLAYDASTLIANGPPAWSGEARVQWQQSIACQLVLNIDPRAAVSLIQMLDDPEHPSVVEMVATTLEPISPLEKQSLVDWIVAKSLPSMTNAALSELATTNRLGAELSLLKWASLEQSKLLLEKLLNPEYSATVQQHAISRLVGNDSQAIQFVVESLDQMTLAVELTALEVLASRREGLRLLIEGVKDRSIAIIRLPLALQRQWQEQADPELRLVLSDSLANRSTGVSEQVLAEYFEALTGEANEGSRQAVFVRICASCHRVNAVGKAVGPDLRSLVDKSSEQILIAVLDPNREVDPKYHVVNLETNSGRILAGILESETELELKIVDAQGNAHSVMREDLESLRKQARSLMPEGLHGEITKEQMRDLIAFLKSQPKVSP